MKQLQNYIDGKWVDAADGSHFDVFDPATGEVVARAADSKPADVERAIDAARKAFDEGSWPRAGERERQRVLLRRPTSCGARPVVLPNSSRSIRASRSRRPSRTSTNPLTCSSTSRVGRRRSRARSLPSDRTR